MTNNIIKITIFCLGLGLMGLLSDFVNKWNNLEQQKIILEEHRIINESCTYGGTYNRKTGELSCYHER